MSFQPLGHSIPGVPGSAVSEAPALPAASKVAESVASLAGANPAGAAAAGLALDTVSALQSGADMSALAGGALNVAAHASPELAKAMQLASQATALMGQAGNAAGAFGANVPATQGINPANVPIVPLVIAEHPLAGQAVSDFASKNPEFMPAPADPETTAAPDDDVGAGAADFDERTRLLRFYSPLPASKALLIESMRGAAALSEQYVFHLSLLSKNASIDLQDMMSKNVSVGVQLADGSEHFINGYVNSFGFTRSDGGFAHYHAEIVPWLTYLRLRTNSRIFQGVTVLDVLEKIYKGDYGALATYKFRTNRSYPKEDYIVQYQETDEHFTCRLLEKYGLFYYFEHSASGHMMIISDDSPDGKCCPPQAAHAKVQFNAGDRWRDKDSVTALAAERSLQPSKIALNTFDFKAPNSMQYLEVPTIAKQGDVPSMEVYDGNPAFAYKSKDDGERDARMRMEVLEWQAKIFVGASDCRGLVPGHTFKLHDHHWFDGGGEGDNDFLVVSVQYNARNNYFERGAQDVYSNTFSAIRRKIPYRPRRAHHAPKMPGPQTATVVGEKGTEIYTDKFGRIKVQFHWDRHGRRDQRSSCWIRVSQPWAGQNWGTISIPRVGQEVIIDYLEGDPDRPICTGRVYNSDQPAPYALPAGAHMMGFKSRSTPGGGGFCEMVIHDQKGKELVNIHSQKDMVTTVQNNQATVVNGPQQTNTVANGFHVTTVKQKVDITSETEHVHLTAATDITLEVGQSKIVLRADGTILIQGVTIDMQASTSITIQGGTVEVQGTRIDLNK
jgi:type VI secretion system secreted protein VgrG